MKKSKIIGIILLSTLLTIPFGSVAKAQPSTYVGVTAGTTYTWKITLDVDGLDELVDNVGLLLSDMEASIAANDFWGYENLTIPETLGAVVSNLFNRTFPLGWEAMNISTLIDAFIVDFVAEANSMMLSGIIPSTTWQDLNFTTFMDLVVDGLNATLPSGWENDPLPAFLNLAVFGFNNSILLGILPMGWEDLTIKELFDQILLDNTPKIRESFILHVLFNEMLMGEMPPGMSSLSVGEILSGLLPSGMNGYNVSSLVDSIISGLNFTMPVGWESWNMATIIDNQSNFVNPMLPPGYDAHNMTTLIELFIEEMMFGSFAMMLPPGILPPGMGFGNATIRDIADNLIGVLNHQWTTTVVGNWTTYKSVISVLPNLGIRLRVDTIGTEVEAYPGGPKGVPIEMTGFFSMDMQNWTEIGDLMNNLGPVTASPPPPVIVDTFISNFTYYYSSYIVDPSTYTNASRALLEQTVLTGGLIVAKNYNWGDISTSFSIPIAADPNGIEGSSEWNTLGLLSSANLKANGITAVSIELLVSTEEIPGFEIGIIVALIPITIIGIVYYTKKKTRTK